jgi:hypothetical protein
VNLRIIVDEFTPIDFLEYEHQLILPHGNNHRALVGGTSFVFVVSFHGRPLKTGRAALPLYNRKLVADVSSHLP